MLKNKGYDFITIGGATEDVTFRTDEGVFVDDPKIPEQKLMGFRYGSKIKIKEAHSSFGGGASNASVNFAGLGFKAAALVAVGKDDRGKKILENLKKNRVDTSYVQKKDRESGFSFLLVGPDNEHIVFSNRAANQELEIGKKELDLIKKSNWVHITSLSGKWKQNLRQIFSLAPEKKISWNPGHVQLQAGVKSLSRFLKKTEVLFVNREEAIELMLSDDKYQKKEDEFFLEIKNLLKALKEYGPSLVVVTRGKKGANAYDGEKFYYQAKIKEKRKIDTTGVGDAFNSSLAVGLRLYQGDVQKAMKLGSYNTASVIAQEGAQNGLLTKKDIGSLDI